ncbi:MAG: hypothetical protein ACLGHL_02000 [Actinomycetota bacterium]
MFDELKRMALITSGMAELTRARAEQVVKDLVKRGDVRRDQASGLVKELLDRSADNRREVTRFIRSEIQSQLAGLGFATKKEVERLERKVARLEAGSKSQAKKTTSKTATPRKSATKKQGAAKKTSGDGA